MPKALKSAEDLVAEGIEIPDDPLAIEALLEGESPEAKEKPEGAEPDKPGAKPEAETSADGGDAGKKAPAEGKKPPDQPAAGDPPKGDKAEEADDGPPKVVLRRTRENLHRTEAELEEERERRTEVELELNQLKAKIEASQERLQEKADKLTGDRSISVKTLDKAKLEALRQDLDDDVVNLLGELVDQHNAQQERIDKLEHTNAELVSQRDSSAADQQEADIDAVQILAVLNATASKEADGLWKRAVGYEKALWADPDWSDKSQREIYVEVGRRIEAHLGAEATAKVLGKEAPKDRQPETDPKASGKPRDQVVEDKLKKARDRASPDSLSDLPAGAPASQSELERLEAMSMSDLEFAYDKALAKGPDAVSELVARLSTVER